MGIFGSDVECRAFAVGVCREETFYARDRVACSDVEIVLFDVQADAASGHVLVGLLDIHVGRVVGICAYVAHYHRFDDFESIRSCGFVCFFDIDDGCKSLGSCRLDDEALSAIVAIVSFESATGRDGYAPIGDKSYFGCVVANVVCPSCAFYVCVAKTNRLAFICLWVGKEVGSGYVGDGECCFLVFDFD